jgi:hypothetical protein
VVLGVSFGLALLARVDNCFIVVATSILLMWRAGIGRLVVPAAAALAVVLPWWIYSAHRLGGLVPESGAAVAQIVAAHLGVEYTRSGAAQFACLVAGRDLTGLFAPAQPNMILGAAMLLALLYGASLRARSPGNMLLVAASACCFVFYTVYLPAFWFFTRYLHILAFALLALGASALAALLRPGGVRRATAGWAAFAIVAMWWTAQDVRFFGHPAGSVNSGPEGAKGYREVAQEILRHVPPGSTLGAMQSGALGYYAGDGIQVFNLDGVVNHEAYRALREKHLGAYVRAARIAYFADWQINVRLLRDRYDDSGATPTLKELFRAPVQGEDEFVLYAVK